jgi:glycosyltransferase domain-containing protein
MSGLNDLTLITLSYKRPEYLLRSLQYWSDRGATIIALDGSPEPIKAEALKGLGKNITYHHAPFSYRERIAMIQSDIATPYVALLADDDFYLPSGLLASIEFLENNSDYACCIGRPVGFGYDSSTGVFGIPGVYGDMNDDYSIVSDTPGLRMREHMGRYMPSTMYAVLRAENWSKTVEAYIKKEFPVFAIVELQMELASAYLGKSAVIPTLSWLKSTELDQIQGPDLSLQRTNQFHDLWPVGSGNNQFREEFIELMADVLHEADQRPHDTVTGEIETAMDDYIVWCNAYFRKTVSFYGVREHLKRVLPARITSVITGCLRTLRSKCRNTQQSPGLHDLGLRLVEAGTVVDMDELQEIITLIHNFHLSKNNSSVNLKT